jgi:hypothetical protein
MLPYLIAGAIGFGIGKLFEEGGETFGRGGITTNEGIIKSFLNSNKELRVGNLEAVEIDDIMYLRNYRTFIAKRMGDKVKISSQKYSQTTSKITNRLKALAQEMGYSVEYVSEKEIYDFDKFVGGGEAGGWKIGDKFRVLKGIYGDYNSPRYANQEFEVINIRDGKYIDAKNQKGTLETFNINNIEKIKYAGGGEAGETIRDNYDALVGRVGDEYYFLDEIFKYKDGFKGATGTVVMPVSKAYYEYATSEDGILERYMDAMGEDEWISTLGLDRDDFEDEDEMIKAIEDGIYDLYRVGELNPFEEVNYKLEEQMRELPEFSDSDEYPLFEIIGVGRIFDKNRKFDKIYNQELFNKIKEIEEFAKGGQAGKKGKLNATYIPKRNIKTLTTTYGNTIKGKDLLDGAYTTRKDVRQDPKMVRTIFEEEEFAEFNNGGEAGEDLENYSDYDEFYNVVFDYIKREENLTEEETKDICNVNESIIEAEFEGGSSPRFTGDVVLGYLSNERAYKNYAGGGFVKKDKLQQARDYWKELEGQMSAKQKKFYNELLKRRQPSFEKNFNDSEIAEYINGEIIEQFGVDLGITKYQITGVNWFKLGFKYIAYREAIEEPEFWEEMNEYAEGGEAKKRRRRANAQTGRTDRSVDKTRVAKPVGYRFTDSLASKLRKDKYEAPTEKQVKKYIGKGIYKEKRKNRSDKDRTAKL